MPFVMFFFFFNDTATTEIYTLSLHDALPISRLFAERLGVNEGRAGGRTGSWAGGRLGSGRGRGESRRLDRKSTRLKSSHANISYAVFCLKKKKDTCSDVANLDEQRL